MRSEDPDLLAAAQNRRFAMPRQQVVADKAELFEDGKDGRAARARRAVSRLQSDAEIFWQQ